MSQVLNIYISYLTALYTLSQFVDAFHPLIIPLEKNSLTYLDALTTCLKGVAIAPVYRLK